jgi:AcrR family transcriptional regulator
MADVAAQAGVARATVFNYFPSKHDLVDAITQEVLAYWRGMLKRALRDETSRTPDLVRALFDHMGWGIQNVHGFYRGAFREIVKIRVGLVEGGAAQREGEAALGLLEQLISRGQRRAELADTLPARTLALAFDSLSNGTILQWLYDERDESLQLRMQRAAEVFLGAVAAASPGPTGALPDVAADMVVPLPHASEPPC